MNQKLNFKPLFDYLDEQFGEVRSDIAEVKQNTQILQTSVDSLAKQIKDFGDEKPVVNTRLDKLEKVTGVHS
jgi:hypothetical protein